MEAHTIMIYWPSREESLGDCAQRYSETLDELARTHDVVRSWFYKGMSAAQALEQPVDGSNPSELMQRLCGRKRVGPQYTDPGGFHLSIWNGQPGDSSMSLSVICGVSHPRLPWNSASLSVSASSDKSDFKRLIFQERVMAALIGIWRPSWGRVASHSTREALGVGRVLTPHAGWLTWLADTDFPAHLVEGFGTVTRLHNGSLITLGDRPLSADRPEDLAILRKGQEALVAAGIAGAPSAA